MRKLLLSAIASLVLVNGADLHIDLMTSLLKTNYKEYDDSGKVIDSETSDFSDMVGLTLDIYGYLNNQDRIMFGIEYNEGETTYNGSTWGGTPLQGKENNAYLLNNRIIYEAFSKDYQFSSYIEKMYFDLGVGYRYWNRGTLSANDYDEKYKWPYFILGFTATETFSKFDYETTFIYHRAVSPQMDADLYGGTTFDLGKTDGYRFELPIRYHLGRNYGISFKYTYDYWKIGKSNTIQKTSSDGTKYKIYEPDSKTRNQYLSLGFYINF